MVAPPDDGDPYVCYLGEIAFLSEVRFFNGIEPFLTRDLSGVIWGSDAPVSVSSFPLTFTILYI